MPDMITNDLEKCVGCNRCIRTCPVEEANIAYVDETDQTKVKIDSKKCIACGACISVCQHESRSYLDDTERFFDDLAKGVPISIFCAPASRANLQEWDRVLALLRELGVRKIYDVSLGADICTWAHIRYIQKHNPPSVITQPCPAIVDYILMHNTELIPYLSPIHSPMLCTAIYMRRYQGITDKIAAISPCIAKSSEFTDTGGLVSYNITFARLEEYINQRGLKLPVKGAAYDHIDSGLGSIYSMPGGLKENVEFFLGHALRIDKSEGPTVVYDALDEFGHEDPENLPAIFDVLNCAEGCNLGTGTIHRKSMFQVNTSMDKVRKDVVEEQRREGLEAMYAEFDKTLRLDDFVRRYRPKPVRKIDVNGQDVEKAFLALGKADEHARMFNCGACGSDTCESMAVKIAKQVNTPDNCIQKVHDDMSSKHAQVLNWQQNNAGAINSIEHDIANIRDLSDKIVENVSSVDQMISVYDAMAKDIDKIAANIHMISLNASIEAARAGEHGRSFAVVAEAIRALANDTQEATGRITKASHDAKDALGSISTMVVTIGEAISKSHDNVSEIAVNTQDVLSENTH